MDAMEPSNHQYSCKLLLTMRCLNVQVSGGLIRGAFLWHETWHEALQEASWQCSGNGNVGALLATLMPLHQQMMDENKAQPP